MPAKPRAKPRQNRAARPSSPARPRQPDPRRLPQEPQQLMAVATAADGYVPGACNIGPSEIRRRRLIAVLGLVAGVALFAALAAQGAPPLARLVLVFPLWGGVFSWLQARRRFCAAFAMEGITNFGEGAATRRQVIDEAAHRADMDGVMRLTRDSFLVAFAITVVTVVLPV